MKSIWKVSPQGYSTMLYRDKIIRDYVRGAFEGSGDVIIKRRVKDQSIVFQTATYQHTEWAPSNMHIQKVKPRLQVYSASLLSRLIGGRITKGMDYKRLLRKVVDQYKRGSVLKNLKLYDWEGVKDYRRVYLLWLLAHSLHRNIIESYKIMEQVRVQYKGLKIEIAGRTSQKGAKMARSKHYTVQYGKLARTTIAIPTELGSATVFTKLGTIGIKISKR